MTKRDVLTKAVALDVFTDEEKAVFQKMIEQLDKKSSKPTKAQLENEVIKGDILEIVADGHARTAKEIGADEMIGSIAVGKFADFIICGEDLKPERIFLGGVEI